MIIYRNFRTLDTLEKFSYVVILRKTESDIQTTSCVYPFYVTYILYGNIIPLNRKYGASIDTTMVNHIAVHFHDN